MQLCNSYVSLLYITNLCGNCIISFIIWMYCNCTKLLTIVRYGLSMSSEVPVVMLRCSGGMESAVWLYNDWDYTVCRARQSTEHTEVSDKCVYTTQHINWNTYTFKKNIMMMYSTLYIHTHCAVDHVFRWCSLSPTTFAAHPLTALNNLMKPRSLLCSQRTVATCESHLSTQRNNT